MTLWRQYHNAFSMSAAAVIAAVIAAVWLLLSDYRAPAGVHVAAQPAAPVAKVGKERVECVPVAVYKPAAKDALKLPEVVKKDPAKRVVAATTTPADERRHTVTTTLDTSTGDFTTFDRAEPLPLIAPSTRTEVGAFIGYIGATPAVRIEARQELLRLKALRVGAIANADLMPGDVNGFVGVGAWAGW